VPYTCRRKPLSTRREKKKKGARKKLVESLGVSTEKGGWGRGSSRSLVEGLFFKQIRTKREKRVGKKVNHGVEDKKRKFELLGEVVENGGLGQSSSKGGN